VLTLDIHHLEYVSTKGSNDCANLVPLCPNCHSLHHKGVIPHESVKAWKMLLLALNEAFDKRQVELLLMLDKVKALWISADTVCNFAGLLASGMVCLYEGNYHVPITHYHVALTEKGQHFVSGWKSGKQEEAIPTKAAEGAAPILPAEIGYDRLNWGSRSPHAANEAIHEEPRPNSISGTRDQDDRKS
jgi:HNH endonuclease